MIAAELRGGNKPSLNEALGWIGSRVDDIYGASVGRLEDVWIDPGTGVPRWLLVKEGRFGGRTTLIPFEDATAGAGHVWVPYEREIVREAPEIEPGAPLTHQTEAVLRSHYAANARAAASRSRPPAAAPGPQPGSAMGTATVRLHGAPEAGPPSAFNVDPAPGPTPPARRQVPHEQPQPAQEGAAIPPVQLPARPAPPIAPPPYAQPQQSAYAPPPQAAPEQGRPPEPQAPPAWEAPPQEAQRPQPPPQPAWQAPPQEAQRPQPQPAWQAPGGPQPGQPPWQAPQPPPWQAPQPPPWQAPPGPQAPIEALQSIASSPDVHYVEIELSGELSIRGELRSVRVVPRQYPRQ